MALHPQRLTRHACRADHLIGSNAMWPSQRVLCSSCMSADHERKQLLPNDREAAAGFNGLACLGTRYLFPSDATCPDSARLCRRAGCMSPTRLRPR